MSRKNSIDTRPIDFHKSRDFFKNPEKKQEPITNRVQVSQNKEAIIPPKNFSSKKDIQPPITSHRVASEKSPPPLPPHTTSRKPPPLPPKPTRKVAPLPPQKPRVAFKELTKESTKIFNPNTPKSSIKSILKKTPETETPHLKKPNLLKKIKNFFKKGPSPNKKVLSPNSKKTVRSADEPSTHLVSPYNKKASLTENKHLPNIPTRRAPPPPTPASHEGIRKEGVGLAKLFQNYLPVIQKAMEQHKERPEKMVPHEKMLQFIKEHKNMPPETKEFKVIKDGFADMAKYGLKGFRDQSVEPFLFLYINTCQQCLYEQKKYGIHIPEPEIQKLSQKILGLAAQKVEELKKDMISSGETDLFTKIDKELRVKTRANKQELMLSFENTVKAYAKNASGGDIRDFCLQIVEHFDKYAKDVYALMAGSGMDLNLLNFAPFDHIDLLPASNTPSAQ